VIIQEFCNGGDLFDLMSKEKMTESDMNRHFSGVVCG
jgi:serine/threonine protein kinase